MMLNMLKLSFFITEPVYDGSKGKQHNIFCEIEAEAMKKGKLANLSHITSTQNLNTVIGLLGEVSCI